MTAARRPRLIPPSRFLTLAVAPAVGLLMLGGAAAGLPRLALVNESPSLPRGLYIRDVSARPAVGSIVSIRQPDAVRPYLSRLGMPAEVRLIKRVAATGGDAVCARGGHVEIRGRRLAVSAADRQGTPLPQWRGCRSLAGDEVFLVGDTPNSFDSRYFGPAPRASIEGVYRRSLTW